MNVAAVKRPVIKESMRIGGKKVDAEGVVPVHYPYTNEVIGNIRESYNLPLLLGGFVASRMGIDAPVYFVGAPLGVLAVAFNWDREAGLIVREEAGFTAEEWTRSRVLLLDHEFRILADSDGAPLGSLFALNHGGADKGCVQAPDGTLTAFARTIGYQDYDGLGWYGVVVRRPVKG